MRKLLTFMLSTFICFGATNALGMRGKQLLDQCQNAEKQVIELTTLQQQLEAACLSYILGVLAGYDLAIADTLGDFNSLTNAKLLELSKLQVCVPAGVKRSTGTHRAALLA